MNTFQMFYECVKLIISDVIRFSALFYFHLMQSEKSFVLY